jgi:hypothetical protein
VYVIWVFFQEGSTGIGFALHPLTSHFPLSAVDPDWLHTKKSKAPMSDISSPEDSFAIEDMMEIPEELLDSNMSKIGLGTSAIRQCLSEQNQRLATWLAEQLLRLLGQLVAHRKATFLQ